MKKLLSCILILALLGVDNLTFALVGNEDAIDLGVIEIQKKALIIEGVQKTIEPASVSAYSYSIETGKSYYLTLSQANTYNYSLSQYGIITYSVTASQINITGLSAGVVNMYIQKGTQVATITFTVTTPVRNLTVSVGSLNIQNASSASLGITDGNGGYSVTSLNTNIASVAGSNTSWTVSGKSIGTTSLTVRDAQGKTLNIPVTVSARNLTVSVGSLNIQNASSASLGITDGNGGYSVTSLNTIVASVAGSNTSWTIYGKSIGTTSLTVRDAQGKTLSIPVTVSARNLTVSTTSVNMDITTSSSFSITDGNGGYTVSSSDTRIASVSGNNTFWTITGKGVGNATVTVRDSQGKTIGISVTVKPKIVASFSSVSFEQIGVGFWQARFTANGSYTEIGFDNGNENYQKLKKESDNIYLVNIYNASCSSNCDFGGKLYLKDTNGNVVYYQNNQILAYNYDTSAVGVALAGVPTTNNEKSALSAELGNTTPKPADLGSFASWIINQVSGAIKSVDFTRNLRNWENLSQKDKDEFHDGLMDTLTLNGFFDVATNFLAGVAIERVAMVIGGALVAKFGKTVAVKLGAKLVPYLGWALLGYSFLQAGEENVTYLKYCAADVSNKYDNLGPLYYCGKLTVNGIFVAAGIAISHVYDRYAFKRGKIASYDKLVLKETPEVNNMSKKIILFGDTFSKNFDTLITKMSSSFARDKQERFVKRMTMMDESMQKEYLNNVNKYVNGFEVGGKYNMLMEADLDGVNYGLILKENGKFKKIDGTSVGRTDYVLFEDGNIFFGSKHSFLSKGKNVVYAGELDVSSNTGLMRGWNCRSGHYLPDETDVIGKQKVISAFRTKFGFDLGSIPFTGKN